MERELASNWTRRGTRRGAGQQGTESIPIESDNICRSSLCHFTAAIVNGRGGLDRAVSHGVTILVLRHCSRQNGVNLLPWFAFLE